MDDFLTAVAICYLITLFVMGFFYLALEAVAKRLKVELPYWLESDWTAHIVLLLGTFILYNLWWSAEPNETHSDSYSIVAPAKPAQVPTGQFDVFFHGTGDSLEFVAISLKKYYAESELQALPERYARQGVFVLAYVDVENISASEPLAIFANGKRTFYNSTINRSSSQRTIRHYIEASYINGGRVGAICSDGWLSSATGRGACSHHGGVAQWRYAQVRNPDAIIATICGDRMLVAGGGERCSESAGIVINIRNRHYQQSPSLF